MFGETRWEKHEENEQTIEARQLFLGRVARSRVLPMIFISQQSLENLRRTSKMSHGRDWRDSWLCRRRDSPGRWLWRLVGLFSPGDILAYHLKRQYEQEPRRIRDLHFFGGTIRMLDGELAERRKEIGKRCQPELRHPLRAISLSIAIFCERENGEERDATGEQKSYEFSVHLFCPTSKMSHDHGWREPCCSEHGS
mgnify:CR=1 FL=1